MRIDRLQVPSITADVEGVDDIAHAIRSWHRYCSKFRDGGPYFSVPSHIKIEGRERVVALLHDWEMLHEWNFGRLADGSCRMEGDGNSLPVACPSSYLF
jgi:hypothetical protein